MNRLITSVGICVCLLSTVAQGEAVAELRWHDSYAEALRTATSENRNLLVYFFDSANERCGRFEQAALSDEKVREKLSVFVLAKLPLDATVVSGGESIKLIEHKAFEFMYGRPGISILDLEHRDAAFYHHVVTAYAFSDRRQLNAKKFSVILELPAGTLTQRTLVYAVRTHPDGPASCDGRMLDLLAKEAESHSAHQAAINYQGHHNWESRFHRISAQLPGGMLATEVVAESWPGEELVDAAVECVNSWRQSSGHWNAVRTRQPFFGYDMKRGSNRIWYGTGIFGRR